VPAVEVLAPPTVPAMVVMAAPMPAVEAMATPMPAMEVLAAPMPTVEAMAAAPMPTTPMPTATPRVPLDGANEEYRDQDDDDPRPLLPFVSALMPVPHTTLLYPACHDHCPSREGLARQARKLYRLII
jgi:hypothetical protein